MKPILVASMGRAGSTLIHDVLKREYHDEGFIMPERDTKLKYNCLYKTHSFAYQIPKDSKVIYMFANPYNVVISSHIHTNLPLHYEHLQGLWHKHSQWMDFDSLCLEDNFDSFFAGQFQGELMTVKYETLKDHTKDIEDFLGKKLTWPPIVPRRTDWKTHEYADRINLTYRRLYAKWLEAPEIEIW